MPSSAATIGSGEGSSPGGDGSPKISGASETPSMRCGAAGRDRRRIVQRRRDRGAHQVAGVDGRRLVELDDPGARGVAAAGAEHLRLAARGSSCGGDAVGRVRRPLAQGRPRHQQDAGDDERDHEDVDAHASDERAEDRPLDLSEHAAVPAHVLVAEERDRPLAGEDAEGVGRGRERDAGDDEADAPAQPAAGATLLFHHQQVGDQAEEERQGEGEDADEPAGHVAQPAAQRAAVPAQVEHEGEEDGDREAGDRRQLAAVP